LDVVAEGVETAAILAISRDMIFVVIQRYLVAQPMTADSLGELLEYQAKRPAHIIETLDQHAGL